MDGQPENDNYERYSARRESKLPKKSGKQGSAREKDGTQMTFYTHTHTHFQVQGLEKGVSENDAPGPVGAYTTTHNNTPTPMPDR